MFPEADRGGPKKAPNKSLKREIQHWFERALETESQYFKDKQQIHEYNEQKNIPRKLNSSHQNDGNWKKRNIAPSPPLIIIK